MAIKRLRQNAAIAIVVGLILAPFVLLPRTAKACGPFFPRAVIVYKVHPEFPLERFARGEIGVIQPTYARSYLAVSYRYLQGQGLTSEQQSAAVELWRQRMYMDRDSGSSSLERAIADWQGQRKKVESDEGDKNLITESLMIPVSKDSYNYFQNCNPNSFQTASATLAARVKQFGADSAEAKDWVRAQDAVYADCIGGNTMPALGVSNFPAIIHADRAYQIAAANFYARNFDAAERMFRNIASDPSSPWRTIAPYMIARTLVRKATLSAGPDKINPEVMAQAEKQVEVILGDNKLSSIHPAARRLGGFIQFRLHPEERLQELSTSLRRNGNGAGFKQDLCDYTMLLDKFQPKDYATLSPEVKKDDMSDWIFTFQSGDATTLEHSIEMWKKTKAAAWLIAAISKVGPRDTRARELMLAARELKPGSPAYGMAVYNRVRLIAATGQDEAARRLLDEVFALGTPAMPQATLNLLASERMKLARNLDEFLKFALRKPAGLTDDENDMETPDEGSKDIGTINGDGRVVADDAAALLNHRLPLSLLAQAASNPAVPAPVQRQIALAAWCRAAILGEDKVGKEMAGLLERQEPSLKPWLDDYLAAPTADGRRFAALMLMVNNPGTRPYVSAGLGRQTPLAELDEYRDNWWCANLPGVDTSVPNYVQMSGEAPAESKTRKAPARFPSFLTPAQKEAATKELKDLAAIPTGPNYLSIQVVDFVNKNPDDPRAPEALAQAVRATRYGCTNKQTIVHSKAAFDLLHKRYPNTTWAKKTKYWYGN